MTGFEKLNLALMKLASKQLGGNKAAILALSKVVPNPNILGRDLTDADIIRAYITLLMPAYTEPAELLIEILQQFA